MAARRLHDLSKRRERGEVRDKEFRQLQPQFQTVLREKKAQAESCEAAVQSCVKLGTSSTSRRFDVSGFANHLRPFAASAIRKARESQLPPSFDLLTTFRLPGEPPFATVTAPTIGEPQPATGDVPMVVDAPDVPQIKEEPTKAAETATPPPRRSQRPKKAKAPIVLDASSEEEAVEEPESVAVKSAKSSPSKKPKRDLSPSTAAAVTPSAQRPKKKAKARASAASTTANLPVVDEDLQLHTDIMAQFRAPSNGVAALRRAAVGFSGPVRHFSHRRFDCSSVR